MSTASMTTSQIARNCEPEVIISDEATQTIEAEGVHPIARFADSWSRLALLGGLKQLQPTAKARQNIFHEQAKMSLMDRFLRSGVPTIELDKPYRMHPHTSD